MDWGRKEKVSRSCKPFPLAILIFYPILITHRRGPQSLYNHLNEPSKFWDFEHCESVNLVAQPMQSMRSSAEPKLEPNKSLKSIPTRKSYRRLRKATSNDFDGVSVASSIVTDLTDNASASGPSDKEYRRRTRSSSAPPRSASNSLHNRDSSGGGTPASAYLAMKWGTSTLADYYGINGDTANTSVSSNTRHSSRRQFSKPTTSPFALG